MAENPEEILAKWRQSPPVNTSKEEVEKVVEHYFPGLFTYSQKGSHWLRITDPVLKMAQDNGFDTGTLGGMLSFSLVSGKTVKGYQIKSLLDAIAIKLEWQQLEEERDRAKREKYR